MWNVKTKAIPVTIGATGTISRSLRQYLSNILRKREIKDLQKTAILGTAHGLREGTDVKMHNIFNLRINITCKYRTAATVYTVETWYVAGVSW